MFINSAKTGGIVITKKILSVVLIFVFLLSIAGCKNKDPQTPYGRIYISIYLDDKDSKSRTQLVSEEEALETIQDIVFKYFSYYRVYTARDYSVQNTTRRMENVIILEKNAYIDDDIKKSIEKMSKEIEKKLNIEGITVDIIYIDDGFMVPR